MYIVKANVTFAAFVIPKLVVINSTCDLRRCCCVGYQKKWEPVRSLFVFLLPPPCRCGFRQFFIFRRSSKSHLVSTLRIHHLRCHPTSQRPIHPQGPRSRPSSHAPSPGYLGPCSPSAVGTGPHLPLLCEQQEGRPGPARCCPPRAQCTT